MCIAIFKEIGMALPTEAILKNAFKNNPDGGGFAFNYHGQVYIKKGYMTFNDFYRAIKEADEKYNLKKRGMLIHTRIATHGGVNPEMCHPFPICADEGALKKIEYVSPYAVIHNGVISLTSTEAYSKKTMSDTAVFIERYLSKLSNYNGWFDQPETMEIIGDLIGSKMAILRGDGKIIHTAGFTKDNDIWYSNSSYKDNYAVAKTYKYVYDYDDDYAYGGYYSNGNYSYPSYGKTKKWVYDSDKKCYVVAPEKADKKDTKKFCKGVGLQKLQKGQSIYFKDGSLQDYEDGYEFVRDLDGKVYYSILDKEELKIDNHGYCNSAFEYLGDGEFLDDMNRKVGFKSDFWTWSTNITA